MWHLQRTVPGWDESLSLLPDTAMIKATEGYQIFKQIKGINPHIFTIHRMVRDHWQTYQGNIASGWFNWEAAKAEARRWFDAFIDGTFRDQIEPYCDSVSWHNEIWAESQNQMERDERVAATEAATYVWNHEYRPTFSHDIQLITGEAAVGNSMPRRIAELAIESGNLLGYHPYEWWIRKQRSDEAWRAATSMRWDFMEYDWGLAPDWIFTECGPLESAVTGWRASECLGGDTDLMVEAVRLWIYDVAETDAYKDGRIKGFSLFTTNTLNDIQWGSFHTQQPEMNKLARMIAANWNPGTKNSGGDMFQQKAWEVTSNMQITGQGGLRLNAAAAIQQIINIDNDSGLDLQIVTDEVVIDGKTVQAAESLTNKVGRRVYVWEAGEPIYYFEDG